MIDGECEKFDYNNRAIDLAVFESDLTAIANENGVFHGRMVDYWQSESEHVANTRENNSGALLLVRTHENFFLESIDKLNVCRDNFTEKRSLPFYKRNFLPHLVSVFQQACAAELLATHGYPLPAYSMLRNIYDQLVLVSAAMQGFTNFYKIEGVIKGKTILGKESRKLRKETERNVKLKMVGKESNLTVSTIEHLKLLDEMFDLEVHGSRFSHANMISWINGGEPNLWVHPKYKVEAVALFINHFCGITWMVHRLLPLLQTSTMSFPDSWVKTWHIIDEKYIDQLHYYASRQQKKVSLAFIEFVESKFPFNGTTLYPLEGRDFDDVELNSTDM